MKNALCCNKGKISEKKRIFYEESLCIIITYFLANLKKEISSDLEDVCNETCVSKSVYIFINTMFSGMLDQFRYLDKGKSLSESLCPYF